MRKLPSLFLKNPWLFLVSNLSSGIRSQLLPLNDRTIRIYTSTQTSLPIYWDVKLTNHVELPVELLVFMSFWLEYCLSFQEMLHLWGYLVISGTELPTEPTLVRTLLHRRIIQEDTDKI